MPTGSLLSWPSLAVAASLGLAVGVGGYAFTYAKGTSYMGNDPATCANCHVMQGHYDGWQQASHHAVATCNDCHTPHNLIGKYATKAENGFWHSFYFTTGTYPENIQARERSRRITENQCRHCHAAITDDISAHNTPSLSCISCHGHVGHAK